MPKQEVKQRFSLRKNKKYKNLVSVGLGLFIATAVGFVGNEAYANEKPVTTTYEVIETKEKINKEQVDTAKAKFENSSLEVKKQEEIKTNVQKDVDKIKKQVEEKTVEVKELEEIAKNSTEENITEAKATVSKEEYAVKDLEANLSNQEKLVLVSKEEVSKQATVIKEKQNELIKSENEVNKAEEDYNTAKETLAGTNAEFVTKALEETKINEEKISKELEIAEKELNKAIELDKKRQEDINKTTELKNNLQKEVDTSQTNLINAENKAEETVTSLNNSKSELEKAKLDVESFNKITLTPEYVENLKKYANFSLSKEERVIAEQNLKEMNSQVLKLNNYKRNPNDDDVVTYDINNLPLDIRTELSLFASDLVNQIREQMETPKTIVTSSAIDFAKKVTDTYVRDNFDSWAEANHHEEGIKEVAREYGLPEGQYYENWAGVTGANRLTKEDLKFRVYDGIVRFMLNGKEWLHAQSVAGINWNNPDEEYLGVSFSNTHNRSGFHLLTIGKTKVSKSTTNNFNTTEIENPKILEKLQETLNKANEIYSQKLSEDRVAQQDLLNTKSIYEIKSKELTEIIGKLNVLIIQKELTPEVEIKVQKLKIELEKAKQDLEKAKENYDNLSADIKVKQQVVDKAKKVLDDKLNILQTARSTLNIEQSKLNNLNNKLSEQEDSVDTIKKELEKAIIKVQTAKDYLYKLENTPELLKFAKEQLVRLEQELSNKEELLKAEATKLDKLKSTQSEFKKVYVELLNKYNKQLQEYRLIELQDLEKEKSKEEIKEEKTKEKQKLTNTGDNTTQTAGLGLVAILTALGLRRKIQKKN